MESYVAYRAAQHHTLNALIGNTLDNLLKMVLLALRVVLELRCLLHEHLPLGVAVLQLEVFLVAGNLRLFHLMSARLTTSLENESVDHGRVVNGSSQHLRNSYVVDVELL